MMHLSYLPANQAWVFTFGDDQTRDLIRMGDGPLFVPTRREAVGRAMACGLAVDARGNVTSLGQST